MLELEWNLADLQLQKPFKNNIMGFTNRLRDKLGRFISSSDLDITPIPPIEQAVADASNALTPELVTSIQTKIFINDQEIDLTNLTEDDALVLLHFGILRPEHFRAIQQMEGWDQNSNGEYDEYDEDEDDD